jgi:hypothetical protein
MVRIVLVGDLAELLGDLIGFEGGDLIVCIEEGEHRLALRAPKKGLALDTAEWGGRR